MGLKIAETLSKFVKSAKALPAPVKVAVALGLGGTVGLSIFGGIEAYEYYKESKANNEANKGRDFAMQLAGTYAPRKYYDLVNKQYQNDSIEFVNTKITPEIAEKNLKELQELEKELPTDKSFNTFYVRSKMDEKLDNAQREFDIVTGKNLEKSRERRDIALKALNKAIQDSTETARIDKILDKYQ